MMEGYQGTDSASNIDEFFPRTDSWLKLFRAKRCDGVSNNDLGEADGDMHGSAAELTEIRFIFAVTRDRGTFISPEFWVGGLFTDFDDGIAKDADSAWDLLRKLCEQFFLKINGYFDLSSGLFKAKWYIQQPYSTETFGSIQTLSYKDTRGTAQFDTNAETREAVKLHWLVAGDDIDNVEVTSFTKSGKKVESNLIFDIRYRSCDIEQPWKVHTTSPVLWKSIEQPSARLRGLFSLKTLANGSMPTATALGVGAEGGLLGLSPQISLQYLTGGDSTYTTYTVTNPYEYAGSPAAANYTLYALEAPKAVGKYSNQLLRLQSARGGFYLVADVLFLYFGFYIMPNNQTVYEMQIPLSTNTLARNIGQRTDITPHADAGSIATRSYLVDLELDWGAKDADASFVKAKYLTRSYYWR